MSVMPAEQTGSVAAVLADWEGDDSGEGLALVIFERWETVRAL